MEKALWNGKLVYAEEIAAKYQDEKAIRKSSGTKDLLCIDNNCKCRILRYCHGEVKHPYFSHLKNSNCDYARFDDSNLEIVKNIVRKLYHHFKNKGYEVDSEVKVIDNHYSHLLIKNKETTIAIEIGTQRTTAIKIEELTNKYHQANIEVKWVVVGDINTNIKENHIFFLKRYLLNESKNKDLIVINWDGSTIGQYKCDFNQYIYNGRRVLLDDFSEVYFEHNDMEKLVIIENELSFLDFPSRFNNWLEDKDNLFKQKILVIEEEIRINEERKEQARLKQIELLKYKEKDSYTVNKNIVKYQIDERTSLVKETISDEEFSNHILPRMNQVEEEVYDSLGRKWIKCEKCGKIEISTKFGWSGGRKRQTLGTCLECSNK